MKTTASSILKPVLCCIVFTALLALVSPLKHLFPPKFERYIYGITGSLLAILVVGLFCKTDGKNFRQVGLYWQPSTIRRFLTGILLGIALSATMMFLVIYPNGLTIKLVENYDVYTFAIWSLAIFFLGWMEEIAFRSYAFETLKNSAGIWTAQIIIAVLFALYHVAGGQDILTSFLGPGSWAFIFGWAVLKTGGISMATGMHFAANIFQAAIGQKKQFAGIWKIDSPDMNNTLQSQLNLSGVLVQIALLVLGIILTYFVIRRNSKAGNKM